MAFLECGCVVGGGGGGASDAQEEQNLSNYQVVRREECLQSFHL